MSARVKVTVELRNGSDEQSFEVDLESRMLTMNADPAAGGLVTLDCAYEDAKRWLEARTIPASKGSKPI